MGWDGVGGDLNDDDRIELIRHWQRGSHDKNEPSKLLTFLCSLLWCVMAVHCGIAKVLAAVLTL